MTYLSIPTAAEQVTPAWLSDALSLCNPGTSVAGLRQLQTIHGTATKIRLGVDYAAGGNPHGLPSTMWFKAGLEAHSGDAHQMSVYAGEACFYRDLAHRLDIDCPQAFAAHVDPASQRAVLLLEDLLVQGCTFGSTLEPLNIDQAAQALAQLARLHGQFWGHRELPATLPWLQGGGPLNRGGVAEMMWMPVLWQRMSNLPRGAYLQGPLKDFDRLREVTLRVLAYDAEHAHCIAHGDPHLGNMYYHRDGRPAFLDWQTTMWGFWAHDVGCFLATALAVEDRRHAERDLIRHYIGELAKLGVQLDFDTAWYEYRRHIVWYFGWVMCPPELQPEANCMACAERACAAALDLGTFDLW